MLKQQKNEFFGSILIIAVYASLAVGRIVNSFDKLASDPSYDFMDEIYRLGIKSFISGSEGYIQFGPRLIAYFAHLFPVKNQAIALSLLTTCLFVILGFIIFYSIKVQTKSKAIGFLCGLSLILIPAASESTVGNHGSVKWSVVVAACVVFSCPNFLKLHLRFSIVLITFAILCSPLAILALAPQFIQLIQTRHNTPKPILLTLIVGLSLTAVQFLYWLLSGKGAQIYGGDIRYRPWSGMGQFWWSIILTPPIFVVGSLIVTSLARFFIKDFQAKHIYYLVLTTSFITISSYITTGIKDSTAVAWQSLSWILSILTIYAVTSKIEIRMVKALVFLGAFIFFGRSAEKWYSSSWYLNDSRQWTSLIQEATLECQNSSQDFVSVQLLLSTVEMPCNRL